MMAIRGGIGMGIGLAILFAFGGVVPAHAQFGGGGFGISNPDGPAWFLAKAKVDAKLEKGDLTALARSMAKAPPTLNPEQLLERLDIFIRAGDRSQADRVIQAIAHTDLTQDSVQTGAAADSLIAHEEWETARHLLDVCPRATPWSKELFVAHWEKASPSSPELERWLANRERLNPRFWSSLYLDYRRRMGTLQTLLDARAAEVRAHPQDLARIEAYIAAAQAFDRPPDPSWLLTTCHLPLAVENVKIGLKLHGRFASASILFLERALQMPFTFDDDVWLETEFGAALADVRSEPTPEAFRLYVKAMLVTEYQAVQQFQKAQTLQEEIAKASPNGLLWIFPDYGRENQFQELVPGAEPRRPVAEVEDKSDYHYWLIQADTYLDMKARDKAQQAYQRAIELTRANPGDNDQGRVAVMRRYFDFLYDPRHPEAAIKWLRSELDRASLTGTYAGELLGALIGVVPANSPDARLLHETIWRYLAARPSWDGLEMRFVEWMVQAAQGTDREAIWTHAIKLAGDDPDRETRLGFQMQRMSEAARAVPVLQDAAQQTKKRAERRTVLEAEFKDAIARKDWPHAKAIWPEYRTGISPNDRARLSQTLLEIAVRSAALDDAMELFRDWTRYDHNIYQKIGDRRGKLAEVIQLADLGLRERLLQYYHDMAVADPESHIPQDILPVLRNPPVTVPHLGGPPGAGSPLKLMFVTDVPAQALGKRLR